MRYSYSKWVKCAGGWRFVKNEKHNVLHLMTCSHMPINMPFTTSLCQTTYSCKKHKQVK